MRARDEIINLLSRRHFWRLVSRGSRGLVYTAYLTSFQKEGMNNISFFSNVYTLKINSEIFLSWYPLMIVFFKIALAAGDNVSQQNVAYVLECSQSPIFTFDTHPPG